MPTAPDGYAQNCGKVALVQVGKAGMRLADQWDGTHSGPTDSAALTAASAFDTNGFVNAISGTFGWSLDPADRSLSLTYMPTPVPEPGTLALVGLTAAGLAGWRRRGQPISPPS